MAQPESVIARIELRARRTELWGQLPYPHQWRTGELEQSGRTAETRTRFQYDDRWDCPECRPHKERKEGGRILKGFTDSEMWVIESDRRASIIRAANKANVDYVVLPVRGGFLGMTTGPVTVEDQESEQVKDVENFVSNTAMKIRWMGSISSSRGLLPPARKEADFYEAHHPSTTRRCWELHPTKEGAAACVEQLKKIDGVDVGWYVRPTSEWRKVGRFEVPSVDLRSIADRIGIKTTVDTTGELDLVTFEAMAWEDPRFQALRRDAKWTPPHEKFQPPPLDIKVAVTVRGNQATA
jgi:hypothetical protein